MSLCEICGKLLAISESGRRPCCQAQVHLKCIQGYAEYCHNSGNPNPSCPVCRHQNKDLQSRKGHNESLLSTLRKSTSTGNSVSTSEGLANDSSDVGQLSRISQQHHALQGQFTETMQEISMLKSRNQKFESELLHLRETNGQLEQQNAELNGKLSDVQYQLETACSHSSQQSQQISSWDQDQKRIRQLESALQVKEKQYQMKCSELKELDVRLSSVVNQQNSKLELLQSKMDSLQENLRISDNRTQESLSTNLSLEEKLEFVTREREDLESRLIAVESSHDDNARLAYDVDYLRGLYQELDLQHSHLLETLAESQNQVGELSENEQNLQQQLSVLNIELQNTQSSLQSSAVKEFDLNQQLANLTEFLKESEENYRSAILENAELEQRFDVLISQQKKYQGISRAETDELKTQLNNAALEIETVSAMNEDLKRQVNESEYGFRELQELKASHEQKMLELSENLNDSELQRIAVTNELTQLREDNASKAVLHENLNQELHQLQEDRDSNLLVVKASHEELAQLRDESAQLRDESAQLHDELAQLRDESIQLHDVSAQLREELAQLRDESVQLREERDSISKGHDALSEDFNQLREAYDLNIGAQKALTDELAQLQKERALSELAQNALTDELVQLREERDSSEIAQKALTDELVQLREVRDSSEIAQKALTDELVQLREDRDSSEIAQKALNDELVHLREERDSSVMTLGTLSDELSQLREEHALSAITQRAFSDELTQIQEERDSSLIAQTNLHDELAQLREERESNVMLYEDRLKELKEEMLQIHSLNESASIENEQLKKTISEFRSDLESSREDSENSELLNSQLADKIEALQEEIARITEKSGTEQEQLQASLDESLGTRESNLQKLALNEAQLHDAKDEIARLNAALNEASGKLLDSNSTLNKRSSECDELKEHVSEVTFKLGEVLAKHNKFSRDNKRLLHIVEQSEEECQSLKEQLRNEHKRHKQISELFVKSLNAHKSEFQTCQEELLHLKDLAKSLEDQVQLANQSRSIEELLPFLESQRTEMGKLQNDHSRVCALLEAMNYSKADHAEQMDAIVDQLKSKDLELKDVRSQNTNLLSTILDLQDQVLQHAAHRSALEDQLKQPGSERDSFENQNNLPVPAIALSNQIFRDASPALSGIASSLSSTSERVPDWASDASDRMTELALSRVSTVRSAALKRASTEAASEAALMSETLSRSGPDSLSPVPNIVPAADIEENGSVNSLAASTLMPTYHSHVTSPALSRASSRTKSPSRPPSTEPPTVLSQTSSAVMRPTAALRTMPGARPVPVRRMGPIIRRPSPVFNADNVKPHVSPIDVSKTQEAIGISEAIVDTSISDNETALSPTNSGNDAASSPVRVLGPVLPLRSAPNRPLSFRHQPMRRGFPAPGRVAPGRPSLNPNQTGRVSPASEVTSPPSLVSTPNSETIDGSRESDADDNAGESASRSQSLGAENSAQTIPPDIPTPNRLAPRRPMPGRPPSTSMRRMPPGPHRPGRASAPFALSAARGLSKPLPQILADNSISHKGRAISPEVAESAFNLPIQPSQPVPARTAPAQLGAPSSRAVPRPGCRIPILPSRAQVPVPNRSITNKPTVTEFSAMSMNDKSPARSRSASPKPPSVSGIGSSQNMADSLLVDRSARSQSADIQPRTAPLKSSSRSKSVFKSLLGFGSGNSDAKKVNFVFDQKSGSWVPESNAVSDDDSASTVLNTVQRLRSQVHQTREEISNATAAMSDSNQPISDQNVIPDEKWIEACELLRESRLRLPKDDPLRIRIDKFLTDSGSGIVSLPDAVSELEDLLQTVESQDEKPVRGSGTPIFMFVLLPVLIAVAASVFYALYPDDAFEMARTFVVRLYSSMQSAEAVGRDGSDRIEL